MADRADPIIEDVPDHDLPDGMLDLGPRLVYRRVANPRAWLAAREVEARLAAAAQAAQPPHDAEGPDGSLASKRICVDRGQPTGSPTDMTTGSQPHMQHADMPATDHSPAAAATAATATAATAATATAATPTAAAGTPAHADLIYPGGIPISTMSAFYHVYRVWGPIDRAALVGEFLTVDVLCQGQYLMAARGIRHDVSRIIVPGRCPYAFTPHDVHEGSYYHLMNPDLYQEVAWFSNHLYQAGATKVALVARFLPRMVAIEIPTQALIDKRVVAWYRKGWPV